MTRQYMTCFITHTVIEIQYSILYRYNDQLLIEDVDRNTHVWVYRYLNTIIIINDYWEIEDGFYWTWCKLSNNTTKRKGRIVESKLFYCYIIINSSFDKIWDENLKTIILMRCLCYLWNVNWMITNNPRKRIDTNWQLSKINVLVKWCR